MTDTTQNEQIPSEKRWIGPLLVLLGGLSIGFAPIGLRLGLDTMGPQAIAFWRYVFATPMVFALVFLVYRRAPVRPNKFVIMAGTFFALDIALWHWALTMTTVANSTFIVNLGNIFVGFLAWFFLKEHLTVNWVIAVFVALIGALLLTQGGVWSAATGDIGAGGGPKALYGDILAVGAAILVSGYMLCTKIARRDIGGLDVLFWVTFTEMIVQGGVTLVSGEAFIPAESAGWRMPLMLAIIVQCLGQGLIITGLGRTPAAIAGVLVLIQPVTAAAISWQIFDESLVPLQILGGGLILVGVILSQTGSKPQKVS